MRERRTAAPGSGKLEAESSLGEHDAVDLRPKHSTRDTPKVADKKNIPPWTEEVVTGHEANQVGLVCGKCTCQCGIKLRARNARLPNHAFHIPLDPSLLPFPVG